MSKRQSPQPTFQDYTHPDDSTTLSHVTPRVQTIYCKTPWVDHAGIAYSFLHDETWTRIPSVCNLLWNVSKQRDMEDSVDSGMRQLSSGQWRGRNSTIKHIYFWWKTQASRRLEAYNKPRTTTSLLISLHFLSRCLPYQEKRTKVSQGKGTERVLPNMAIIFPHGSIVTEMIFRTALSVKRACFQRRKWWCVGNGGS